MQEKPIMDKAMKVAFAKLLAIAFTINPRVGLDRQGLPSCLLPNVSGMQSMFESYFKQSWGYQEMALRDYVLRREDTFRLVGVCVWFTSGGGS